MNTDPNIAYLLSLRDKRARLDALIESVEAFLKAEGVDVAALGQPTMLPAEKRTTAPVSAPEQRKGELTGMPMTDAVKEFLEKAKGPLTVAEIAEGLKEAGRADAQPTGVYNALWRRKKVRGDVESLPDNRWQIVVGATPKPPADRKLGSRGGPTTYTVTEQVLREASKPLHANVIVERIAKLGKHTNTHNLSGTLPQDVQKRFENLGGNVWALREWPEEVKRPPSSSPSLL